MAQSDLKVVVLKNFISYDFNNSYDGWTYTQHPERFYGTVALTPDGVVLTGIEDAHIFGGWLQKEFSFLVKSGTHIEFTIRAEVGPGISGYNPGGWAATITYSDSSVSELLPIAHFCRFWLPGESVEWDALATGTIVTNFYDFLIPAEKIGLNITSIQLYLEAYAIATNKSITAHGIKIA